MNGKSLVYSVADTFRFTQMDFRVLHSFDFFVTQKWNLRYILKYANIHRWTQSKTFIAEMSRTSASPYSQVPPFSQTNDLSQGTEEQPLKVQVSDTNPNASRKKLFDWCSMKHSIRGWEHFVNDPRIVKTRHPFGSPVYLIPRFRILIFDCLSLSFSPRPTDILSWLKPFFGRQYGYAGHQGIDFQCI